MKKSRADRRIVSKSEYVANIGRKGIASSIGAGLLLTSLVCILIVGLFVWLIVSRVRHGPPVKLDTEFILTMSLFLGIIISAAVYIYRLGKREIKAARKMDVGVPFTHANTADLPATNVLVRASEKPSEEQASILLRAAAETNATPTDQLLRPVTEKIVEDNTIEVQTLKAGGDANG